MSENFALLLEKGFETLQIAIIFIISISIHEFAHAYTSYKFGDPTPLIQGRLTPNPLKHIDPIWFILIFLIGFWRGRAVQIDPSYYKKPYRDELLVALAGPASNIILGFIGILVMLSYLKISGLNPAAINSNELVIGFWSSFAIMNFALAAFNMIPLPPLDGYRLIKVINHKAGNRLEQNTFWISILFLALVVFGPFEVVLHTYIIGVADFLFRLFILPLSQLFF